MLTGLGGAQLLLSDGALREYAPDLMISSPGKRAGAVSTVSRHTPLLQDSCKHVASQVAIH